MYFNYYNMHIIFIVSEENTTSPLFQKTNEVVMPWLIGTGLPLCIALRFTHSAHPGLYIKLTPTALAFPETTSQKRLSEKTLSFFFPLKEYLNMLVY